MTQRMSVNSYSRKIQLRINNFWISSIFRGNGKNLFFKVKLVIYLRKKIKMGNEHEKSHDISTFKSSKLPNYSSYDKVKGLCLDTVAQKSLIFK